MSSEKPSGNETVSVNHEDSEAKGELLESIFKGFDEHGEVIPGDTLAQLQNLPVAKLHVLQAFASNQLEQLRGGERGLVQEGQKIFMAVLAKKDNIT